MYNTCFHKTVQSDCARPRHQYCNVLPQCVFGRHVLRNSITSGVAIACLHVQYVQEDIGVPFQGSVMRLEQFSRIRSSSRRLTVSASSLFLVARVFLPCRYPIPDDFAGLELSGALSPQAREEASESMSVSQDIRDTPCPGVKCVW